MKTNYTFHADPGHGWLEVDLSELFRLEIADKITEYSYHKNGKVYLEQDCDYSTFVEAKEARNEIFTTTAEHLENTFVRNLPRYDIVAVKWDYVNSID